MHQNPYTRTYVPNTLASLRVPTCPSPSIFLASQRNPSPKCHLRPERSYQSPASLSQMHETVSDTRSLFPGKAMTLAVRSDVLHRLGASSATLCARRQTWLWRFRNYTGSRLGGERRKMENGRLFGECFSICPLPVAAVSSSWSANNLFLNVYLDIE